MSQPLVWLITGASAGFGTHLTKIILARGDRVIATARSQDKIIHLESAICKTLQIDVTDSEQAIHEKAKEAIGFWGRVDVVVNNAGVGAPGIAEEAGATGFMKQFQTNFFGAINVTNAFLPYMRAARSGTVVFIGSRHAWMTRNPTLAPYNSSKAALHAYAETLQHEIRQFGVRVLIAQPGAHRTNVITSSLANNLTREKIPDYEQLRQAIAARYAKQNGLQPGDPEKAMTAVVDVVRGEGVALGRPMPLWLVLGTDAEQDLRDYCADRLKNLDEWQDVTRSCAVSGDFVLV
ncbi:short-chain oxidoreductase [Cytidiella melzeri]|nr:short-chain oxidoreductase [Cytidiella melzeri]